MLFFVSYATQIRCFHSDQRVNKRRKRFLENKKYSRSFAKSAETLMSQGPLHQSPSYIPRRRSCHPHCCPWEYQNASKIPQFVFQRWRKVLRVWNSFQTGLLNPYSTGQKNISSLNSQYWLCKSWCVMSWYGCSNKQSNTELKIVSKYACFHTI